MLAIVGSGSAPATIKPYSFSVAAPVPAAAQAVVTLSSASCEPLLVTDPAAAVLFALVFVPFLAADPKAFALAGAVSVPLPVDVPTVFVLSSTAKVYLPVSVVDFVSSYFPSRTQILVAFHTGLQVLVCLLLFLQASKYIRLFLP